MKLVGRGEEAVGDPIAKIALGGLDDTGLGRLANRFLTAQAEFQGVNLDMDSVRLDIMRFHVTATDVDVAGVPGLLNPKQVAEYHHQVFQLHGLGSTAFGGTPIYGKTWEVAYTRLVWCRGCDGQ